MGVVALFAFVLLRLTPGDPAAVIAGDFGAGTPRILVRYILPALVAPLIVQGTYIYASAILVEA